MFRIAARLWGVAPIRQTQVLLSMAQSWPGTDGNRTPTTEKAGELGLEIGVMAARPANAIFDVGGCRVIGQKTLIEGAGPREFGRAQSGRAR